ncbi:TonB-dependent receptor [Myxococcota bacterium]|nr:TonB-dependent receptor [Myxococcota bacterium]
MITSLCVALAVAGAPAVATSTTVSSTVAPVKTATAAVPEVVVTEGVASEGADEELVITGSRVARPEDEAPVVVEVIGRGDIEASGAENVTEILESAAGVQITQQFGRGGIELQGLDPQYTLILVDGQRVTGRVNGTIDLNRFSAERIERIEIVKGAASALYGADALAGVVNIITRKTEREFEAEGHLSYGSFKVVDGSVTGGVSGERFNARLTAGYHRGDAYTIASDTRLDGDPSTSGPGFEELSGEIRGEYSLTDEDKLILRGDYLLRDATSIAATPIPRRDGTFQFQRFDQANRSESYSIALTHDRKFPKTAARLQSTAYFNGWREQFLQDVRGVPGDVPVDTREQLAQATVQYDEPMENHLVTFGTELLFERLEASERICRPLEPNGCIPDANGDVVGATANDATRVRFATFLQDEWMVSDYPRLVIVPGIRADVDSLFGTRPTPKIALRFDPIDAVVLRASFGFGFRAPSFRELYLSFTNPSAGYNVSGNPGLDPETSRSFNLGAEVMPVEGLKLAASFYYNDLTNLIDFGVVRDATFGQLGLFEYVNIAEAHTLGVESTVSYSPFRQLSLTLGYTFLDSENETTGQPLVGRAKHRTSYKIRFHETWSDVVAFVQGQWVGPRTYPAFEAGEVDERSPAYLMFDARIEKRLGEHLDLFVGGENLLDASDARFLLVRPRVLYAGVTGRL